MTVLNFAQWAIAYNCVMSLLQCMSIIIIINLSDRWYIAILAHCYSCMHEGGRYLSMGVFGGGGDFLLLGHLNLFKLHRKYSIFDSH